MIPCPLVCIECLAMAADGVYTPRVTIPPGDRLKTLSILAERLGHDVDPTYDVVRLGGIDATRWLAAAAAAGEVVEWEGGSRWRPTAIASRHGRLVCEVHWNSPR